MFQIIHGKWVFFIAHISYSARIRVLNDDYIYCIFGKSEYLKTVFVYLGRGMGGGGGVPGGRI